MERLKRYIRRKEHVYAVRWYPASGWDENFSIDQHGVFSFSETSGIINGKRIKAGNYLVNGKDIWTAERFEAVYEEDK